MLLDLGDGDTSGDTSENKNPGGNNSGNNSGGNNSGNNSGGNNSGGGPVEPDPNWGWGGLSLNKPETDN